MKERHRLVHLRHAHQNPQPVHQDSLSVRRQPAEGHSWALAAHTDPEILLLDEPTRGIDVGAKYEIYQLIIDLAKQGKTVIMVSSEMPELLGVCDRILVMSGCKLAGEVDENCHPGGNHDPGGKIRIRRNQPWLKNK